MAKVLAVVAAAGLTSGAMAQSFEARVALRDDHTNNSTPEIMPGGELWFSGADTYSMQVLFGGFNAQGFSNGGMFNFMGTITVTRGTSVFVQRSTNGTGAGRRAPYNFGPSDGEPGLHSSLSFDAVRDLLSSVTPATITVPWNFGDPEPTGEGLAYQGDGAPDTYFPGYRFSVVLQDSSFQEIQITVSGIMQVISGWSGISVVEPTPDEPGSVTFMPVIFEAANVHATFGIPAPGAATLLGLGGLVAARRRR